MGAARRPRSNWFQPCCFPTRPCSALLDSVRSATVPPHARTCTLPPPLAPLIFAEAGAVAVRILLLQSGELPADRPIRRGESMEELRVFYFRMTGEVDEAAGMIQRAGRVL